MATGNDVNAIAAKGFQEAATVYEQARPSYPEEVIHLIKSLCHAPTTIVDLGAGTGKLTRLLSPIGARNIIAVEPVPSMREKLKSISSITQIVDGSAEHIPLDDNTADVITCGQSFHWFANERALAEMHRVLKPNGLLILIWNLATYQEYDWAKKISELVDSHQPKEATRYKSMAWKTAFDNQTLFSPLEHRQFVNVSRITRDTAINRVLSTSFIAAMTIEDQQKLINEIRQILDQVEELRDKEEFDARYATDVYWSSAQK